MPFDVSRIVFDVHFRYIRSMIVSLIAAASDNNVIGKDNWMPWHLPAELAYFRDVTRGKPVIMGRKTLDAMGRPMPKRHNIVVSRQQDLQVEGVDTAHSVEEAIELTTKDAMEEIFVIGGEQIYSAFLPHADRIYLTRVHTNIEGGEAFFPEFDENEWSITKNERHEADMENPLAFTVLVYERKKRGGTEKS
nr:Dihydrofolate reductase [uncultured bacterium]